MEAPLGFKLKYCEEDYRHYVWRQSWYFVIDEQEWKRRF